MKKFNLFLALLIYNLFIVPLLFIAFHILGLFNKKIKAGIKGRKNLLKKFETEVKQKIDPQKPTFWFHSSSLGEFEQAKPIIRKLKESFNPNVIATFFSPSGYEHSKNYPFADIISYIPFDSVFTAKKFISLIKSPRIYLFLMKYDLWPNHLFFARKADFTLCLANAIIDERKTSSIFKRFFYSTFYEMFDFIFLISPEDEISAKRLNLNRPKIIPTGDTRYDQVYLRSKDAMKKELLPDEIAQGKKILVAGSTWKEDEDVLIPVILKIQKFEPNFLTILVPHEPTRENIERIEREINASVRYLKFSELKNYGDEKLIIVDSVGFLMSLYAYADVAYVGGSFKQGIHNVLEPAVYGIPVLYGPKIQNSPEAQKLAQIGGGLVVKNKKQLYRALRELLSDENLRKEKGRKSYELVGLNIGSTERMLKSLGLNF